MKKFELIIDILIILAITTTAFILTSDMIIKCLLAGCGLVVLFDQYKILKEIKPNKKKKQNK